MRKFARYSVILLVAVLAVGCIEAGIATAAIPTEEVFFTEEPIAVEVETESTEPPEGAGPFITPETIVLDGDLFNRYLMGIEGNTFIFSFQILEAIMLERGDILVGEITESTPNGFLRRVIDVSSDGMMIRVDTEPATLEDVFIQADIEANNIPLDAENIVEQWEISGLQLMAMGMQNRMPSGTFSINLKNVVVYDDDLNPDTREDQVLVNGMVSLEPNFSFSTRISGQQLRDMKFLLTVDETSELTVSSKVNLMDWVAPQPIPIAWYRFKPIIIWVDFVPVFVTPKLSLYIGMDGKISAAISTGVTQETSLTAGLVYRNGPNGDWDIITPFEGFQPSVTNYQPPEFKYESEIVTYSRVELQLMIYDLAGPTGKVDGYLKLEIAPEPGWWRLYNGIKVNIGVTAEVFSHVWFEYSEDVYHEEWLVDQAQHSVPDTAPETTDQPEADNIDHDEDGWSCWTWGFIVAAIVLLIFYIGAKN